MTKRKYCTIYTTDIGSSLYPKCGVIILPHTRCKNQKEKEFAEGKLARVGLDPGKYLPPGILKIYYRMKLLFHFLAPIEHSLNASVIHQCT